MAPPVIVFIALLLALGAKGGKQFVTHGMWSFTEDIITTPVDIIENVIFKIRGESYSDIKRLSMADPALQVLQEKFYTEIKKTDLYDSYLFLNINRKKEWEQKKICSPWGKVDTNCNCEQVCPLSFSLLSINAHQYKSKKENELPFTNYAGDYWDGNNSGHCWGHAVFTQKLRRLAIFHPNDQPPFAFESKEWVKFYRKILKNISKDQAQIVPGFKNIREFASHPLLTKLFANRVVYLWGKKAMSLEGLAQTSFKLPPTRQHNLNYISKLKSMLEHYITPVVLIGGFFPVVGATTWKVPFSNVRYDGTHVVIVSRVKEEMIDGVKRIVVCYEDNNYEIAKSSKCDFKRDVFSLEGDDIVQWKELKFIVYHEKYDAASQLRSLWKLCRKSCGSTSLLDNKVEEDNLKDFEITVQYKRPADETCQEEAIIVLDMTIAAETQEAAEEIAANQVVEGFACGEEKSDFTFDRIIKISSED